MSQGIGKRILNLREKRGLTLSELEILSGVKAQTINAIERGKSSNPTMEVLKKLTIVFDVSSDYLIFGKVKSIKDLDIFEVPSGKIYIEK